MSAHLAEHSSQVLSEARPRLNFTELTRQQPCVTAACQRDPIRVRSTDRSKGLSATHPVSPGHLQQRVLHGTQTHELVKVNGPHQVPQCAALHICTVI
jgi:hypothetical protein